MQKGFSLVELSIVLVILGLLTGGILAGQSLIRASELRAANTEYQRYTSAITTFRDKYFALPGDMPNATKFWTDQTGGTADGVVAACANLTTASTDQKTCNGNGNGLVAEPFLNGVYDTSQYYESYRAWQHLANAGLIEGSYSGVSGTGRTLINNSIPRTNVPASKAGKSSAWLFRNMPQGYTSANAWFAAPWGNFLVLGSNVYDGNSGPVLKPEEAWNMDTKFDDGKPGYGAVLSYMSLVNPNCVASDTANTDYNLSYGSTACALNFRYGI